MYQTTPDDRSKAALLLHVLQGLLEKFDHAEMIDIDDSGLVTAAVSPPKWDMLEERCAALGMLIIHSKLTSTRSAINQHGRPVSIERPYPVLEFACRVLAGRIDPAVWEAVDLEMENGELDGLMQEVDELIASEPADEDITISKPFVFTTNFISNSEVGRCCQCETRENVNYLVPLMVYAPEPGKGWGNPAVGMYFTGAVAVVCDACFAKLQSPYEIRLACAGVPVDDKRVPANTLTPLPVDLLVELPRWHNRELN